MFTRTGPILAARPAGASSERVAIDSADKDRFGGAGGLKLPQDLGKVRLPIKSQTPVK